VAERIGQRLLDLLAQPGLELVAGELGGDGHDQRGAVQGERT
jgi:hypothetical protein